MQRRDFLIRSLALGCSAAASPMLTPVAFAEAPWEGRLVVIILRGGMDGLDALRPYGIKKLDMPLTPHKVWSALQGAENLKAAE